MKEVTGRFMGWAAERAYNRPLATLFIIVVASITMFSCLGDLEMDTSSEGLLKKTDPMRREYDAFRREFGRDEVIVAAVRMPEKPTIPFFDRLKDLHEDLEKNVPGVEEVTSLINARHVRGTADSLVVEDLFENYPKTRKELGDVLSRMDENPNYVDTLISKDRRLTALIIKTRNYSSLRGAGPETAAPVDDFSAIRPMEQRPFLTDEESSEIVSRILETVKRHEKPDFRVMVSGSPVISHFLNVSVISQMGRFTAAAVVMILLVLLVIFRNWVGILLPMAVVSLSLLFTFATMAVSGFPVTLVTQILPSFLLTVGLCDSIHVLTLFFKSFRDTGDKRSSLVRAYSQSGKALMLTSLTTFLGLLSFAGAEVAPVSQFGMYAASGVLYAFLFTLFTIPSALSILPVKRMGLGKQKRGTQSVLVSLGHLATGHYKITGGLSLIACGLSLFFVNGLTFSHNILAWFPEGHEIRRATAAIDGEMHGTTGMDILVDTGSSDGIYNPEFLGKLEKAVTDVEAMSNGGVYAGKAWSVTTIIKEINKALGGGDSRMYKIPDSAALVAQEFFLFENSGSDDLSEMADRNFRKARFSLKAPFVDAVRYSAFMEGVGSYFRKAFPDAVVTVTGTMPLLFRTVTATIRSMALSFLTAFAMIGLIMVFSMGDLRLGLISIIPNVIPISFALCVVRGLQIPLDLFTVLIGNIAIGLVVDDTLHFIHHFRNHFQTTGDRREAIMMTYESVGTSMVFTSVVLAMGFLTFTLSSMNNLTHFGLITAFVIVLALISDLLVTPSVIMLVYKDKIQGEEKCSR
jgi:predicted RND superfamily exporter protein